MADKEFNWLESLGTDQTPLEVNQESRVEEFLQMIGVKSKYVSQRDLIARYYLFLRDHGYIKERKREQYKMVKSQAV